MSDPTNDQKAQAHIMANELGLPRPRYEALAKAVTGKKSMLDMTRLQAARFINVLNAVTEGVAPLRKKRR